MKVRYSRVDLCSRRQRVGRDIISISSISSDSKLVMSADCKADDTVEVKP